MSVDTFMIPSQQHPKGCTSITCLGRVFLGDHGWVGLDPTNRKVVDETYVVLAVGRDYYDVAPVSGSYFGDAGCHLNINVQVEVI